MTSKTRRIIYYIFSVIFVVLTIVILLYASGYRYDLQRKHVYQTGLLVLRCNSTPNTVIIDGAKKMNGSSEIKISNLKPGSHEVRLEKDGYISWQKTVIVKPGEATTETNIDFFKEQHSELIEGGLQLASLSPSGDLLAFTKSSDPKTVLVMNLSSESLVGESIVAPASVSNIEWSPSEDILLLSLETLSQKVLAHRDSAEIQISQFLPNTTEVSQFRIKQESHLLIFRNATLIDLDTITGQQKHIAENVLAWKETSDGILLIQQTSEHTVLQTITDGVTKDLVLLPTVSHPTFVDSINDRITILDSATQTLSLVFKESGKYQSRTFTDIIYATWLSEKNILAYGNEVEISVYDPKTDETTLLTRSGTQFNAMGWLDPLPVLYTIQETGVQLFQIEDFSVQQAVSIFPSQAIALFPQVKNNRIYFVTPSGTLLRQDL